MTDTTQTQTVTINEKQYTVQRFRGLKAILVLSSITRIVRDVPDLMAQANKTFASRHTVTITESMAKLPRWDSFTTADFDKAEHDTGRREIELPDQATSADAILTALPMLLESTARREVVRLFALMLIPNVELKIADQNDNINGALDSYSDVILFDADIDELMDVAIAAQESIKQLDEKKRARVGELFSRALRAINPSWAAQVQAARTPDSETSPMTPNSTEPTLPPDVPTLSTDSDSPTDGPEKLFSTMSLGAS
jgi:hypothetical protein